MNEQKIDRVNDTIDRLISNLPDTIDLLRSYGLTSLPVQLQTDLDNLIYWQRNGGLVEKERSESERLLQKSINLKESLEELGGRQ